MSGEGTVQPFGQKKSYFKNRFSGVDRKNSIFSNDINDFQA
jgi:hypothetical protein